MTRRIRILVVALVVSVALACASPADAVIKQSKNPLRQGTIAGGLMVMGPNGAPCRWMVDCARWLATGCPKSLAVNPALHTSIVDVASLAGTTRTFGFVAGWTLAAVQIEFWSPTCERMTFDPLVISTYEKYGGARIPIPAGAKWMTIPVIDSTPMKWQLT